MRGLVIAGLLSWPFLKLIFLGEGQRIRAHDVVLVAICTLVGLSLVSIGALDFFAYNRRLEATLDDQGKVSSTRRRNEPCGC